MAFLLKMYFYFKLVNVVVSVNYSSSFCYQICKNAETIRNITTVLQVNETVYPGNNALYNHGFMVYD